MPDATRAWADLLPDTAQVLICDLQPQIVARSKTTEPKSLARSANVLLRLAQLYDLPCVLSVVPEGGKQLELIEELKRFDFARTLPRVPVDPFLDDATMQALATTGRKTLILAGFAVEAVVLHAAMSALAAGHEVLVPVDACGGMSAATEAAAFRQIEAAGAVTTSVTSIGTKLSPNFMTPQGEKMFAIIQDIRLA